MHRRVRQLIAAIGAATAVGAVTAAPAAAATTATTGSATNITTTSATLNGVVGTGGQETRWAFQYGTSTNYTTATVARTIPAGGGNVSVSATIRNLKANTTYHYRLVVTTTGPAPYYYIVATNGRDRTFRTRSPKVPPGKLLLTSTKLKVSRKSGKVGVPLKCASRLRCRGRLTISTQARVKIKGKRRMATIVCASGSYSIRAGRSAKPQYKVSGACRALLGAARKHTIKANLTVRPSTGQKRISRTVSLTLVR